MRMRRMGAGLLLIAGCATLRQIAALRQVDFAITRIVNGRLAGVELDRIRSYSDLTAADALRIGSAVAQRELPLEFTVNVEATNPADNNVTARMTRLRWTLLLDDRETIAGDVDQPVELPPGVPRVIPVAMRLDLTDFFDGPARSLVDLALAVVGENSESRTVTLRAVPTIETPLGPIEYPGAITIARRTVGGGAHSR